MGCMLVDDEKLILVLNEPVGLEELTDYLVLLSGVS